ncbi:MAG: Fic family protein [Bacteroidetes bacterium]|nr:Fic family protein [Bacteroidota bacterium]
MYIYQRKNWPQFTWDEDRLIKLLTTVSHRQGRLIGRMESLGFSLQAEASLLSMTLEILKSNEIEGQILNPDQVRSSIARKLGMDISGLVPADRNVDGVVEVMLNATQKFNEPLTQERLFGWHAALFPSGRSGMHRIVVGKWRDNKPDDPMQVVSGALGKEKVHFEAPDSKSLSKEMKAFLKWFNDEKDLHPIIKAAVAHLWFVTVHPFDDGNGRIARTIADMQLTRADGISKRFYSMSAQIRIERKQYYDILEKTQQGALDITQWLLWFLGCLDRAIIASEEGSAYVINKAKFWHKLNTKKLNDRQKLMVNKLLDGFDGTLTSSKWAKICKCSQDTALRDIQDLITQKILEREDSGGRSTNYKLAELHSI